VGLWLIASAAISVAGLPYFWEPQLPSCCALDSSLCTGRPAGGVLAATQTEGSDHDIVGAASIDLGPELELDSNQQPSG